ncbi:ABC transporter ATP-binding protein/permease [Solibacillus sp. MA9]|uniref:ABC transporter ATP-binding protein/permease n=1 Tax=Solibacillus palustris TaxID=2908203 RepID=A0ABS9UFX5_9BACL|nr:ABC transporter ATP-binding protein [Solibacillus sp. MA9]MCH7323257.1 ABC transporter ATP-binding protein/permease [Solibacillus sp. MA9]
MRFVKPYKFLLVLTIIIGILKFAIPLFLPWLLQVILDDVLLNGTLSTDEKTKLLFTWIGIALVLFFVVRPPIEYYRQYFAQNLSNNILFDIRKELYGHLQRLSLKYYANTRAGEVISRVINDVEQTKNFVMTGLMNLWLDLVTIIIVVGIMLSMNVKLTLVSLIVLPFYAFSVKYFFGKLRSLTKDRSQALAGVQSYLHERVAGMSIIKSFTLEKHEQQIFDDTNGEFLNKALAHSRWNAKSFAVVNTITEMAPLIVIGYAGYQYLNDALTIGVMVAFYAYIERLYGPLRRLVSSSTTLTQSIASMDRMFELMDEKYDVQNKENAIDLPQAKGKLQFKNVSFQYDVEGKTILNEVDFMIEPGQTVAFVGMSGGGKSTIVSLIPRFYDATAGAVKIDDYNVKDVTLNSLRSQIGIVLQDNILFSDSVKQNILMGNPYATDDQVIAAAKAANAHDFIMSLSEGYNTKVGERGVKLSGGQKQRVAIARVFLKNPPILVLDEATSALDLESEALIQESLDRLAHDRTTIIIAHRLSTITHADKIFVIEHGEVSEAGTHDELMGKNGAYYNLFQVQKLD